MKILSIQGHFGNLGGRKLEFGEGFCRSVLPNGWGKSTLFALIRIMLFGLDPGKEDTAFQLCDKTRYAPMDGRGMSGRMTVEYGGQVIAIERISGKTGPMQEFRAYDPETGAECPLFDANTCGRVLTGLSEDAFLSSMMIDGGAMQRPSEGLSQHILSLSQTGDSHGQQAIQTMEQWKAGIEGEDGQSVLSRLAQVQVTLGAKSEQSAQLLREWETQNAENLRLEQEVQQAHAAYERIYRDYAGNVVREEEHLEAQIVESTRKIAQLEAGTPAAEILQPAAEALQRYERAVQTEREKRELLPQQGSRYDQALELLDQERLADEVARNEAAKPHIRWWALIMALLFAVASAATVIFNVQWGAVTPYAHYALSGLAVLAVIIAFAGSVRKCELPVRDFKEERAALVKAEQEERTAHQAAAAALQQACDALMNAAQKLDPKVSTIEQAVTKVDGAQENQHDLQRERETRQELVEREKNLRVGRLHAHDQTQQVLRARETLAALQKQLETGLQTAARLKERANAPESGAPDDRLSRESIAQHRQDALRQLEAIDVALSVTKSEQDTLTARISPQIIELTREYLREMTAGEYTEVQLNELLEARCAGADGTMRGALQLSSGARDQLYFALRLAVCEVLGGKGESAPILLDDPFLTFDDARAARAIALLRRLAKDRQIILLTCRRTYPLQQSPT